MSDPVSALNGATFEGFASIAEIGPLGMITLRCKHDVKALSNAVKAATGMALPAPRRIVKDGAFGAAWMAPDELLLILPYDQVANVLETIAKSLKADHHLAVDVSDARAVFRITGAKAHQVLMKLTPADLAALQPGEIRRSRVAQVAAAFWAEDGGFSLVCFRSVAPYVMGLLTHSAQPGSELDPAL
ncbi:MAG: sarcosine oxidase subunit gamma [Paracoccaceae bacterium]